MKSLDELLEDIAVHPPCMWENDEGPKDWFAVSSEDAGGGIVAYFQHERHAFGFRLMLINMLLNGNPPSQGNPTPE